VDDKGNLYAMLEAPKPWRKQDFGPKRTSISHSATTRKSPAPAAQGHSPHCWHRAASGSEFVLDEGLLITEGIMKGLDKPPLVGIARRAMPRGPDGAAPPAISSIAAAPRPRSA